DAIESETYTVSVTPIETYNCEMDSVETATVFAEVSVEDNTVVGDIDGDGLVTVLDALMLIRTIVNDETVNNGDINGDGKVGLLDVIRILKLIAQ
ncbi:MAG: dockerin type I repeat-containing protein, partial [Clostridia bacterium]|nr:dockerin type I repeat-containing protein [Clostridia bacterium]